MFQAITRSLPLEEKKALAKEREELASGEQKDSRQSARIERREKRATDHGMQEIVQSLQDSLQHERTQRPKAQVALSYLIAARKSADRNQEARLSGPRLLTSSHLCAFCFCCPFVLWLCVHIDG